MRIMFEDLNEYAQKRLLAEAGIKSPEERNWYVESIAIVHIEEEDGVWKNWSKLASANVEI